MNQNLLTAEPEESSHQAGTKMESFAPLAGSIVVLAYDVLGAIPGVVLEAREIRSDKGGLARGVLLTVTQNEHRNANAFIDADEIPELLKGFVALLSVKANATQFQNFEVRYKTKGAFELVCFNTKNDSIGYSIRAGRGTVAAVYNLQMLHLTKLKSLFEIAQQKFDSLEQ